MVVVEGVRAATGRSGVRGICQWSAAVGSGRRRKDAAVVRGLLRRRRQRVQGLERVRGRQGGRVLLRLRGLGLLVRRRRGPQPEVQKSRFRRVRRSQQALSQRIHRHHQKICGTFRGRTRRKPRRRRRRSIHGSGHYRVSRDRRRRPLSMLPLPDGFMLKQRRLLSPYQAKGKLRRLYCHLQRLQFRHLLGPFSRSRPSNGARSSPSPASSPRAPSFLHAWSHKRGGKPPRGRFSPTPPASPTSPFIPEPAPCRLQLARPQHDVTESLGTSLPKLQRRQPGEKATAFPLKGPPTKPAKQLPQPPPTPGGKTGRIRG